MKILALDTSLDSCSVALLQDDKITEKFQLAPKQQTQLILPMLQQLLQETGITLKQLDALAFAHGPANFTGVRITVGIIQGLALANDLPVFPISTLQAFAQGAHREFGANNILVAIDARMQEVYWGVYQLGKNNLMTALQADQIISPAETPLPETKDWLAIGNGWEAYGDILKARFQGKLTAINASTNLHAQDLAGIAKDYFLQGKFLPKEQALPLYLRGDGKWKKM